MPPASAVIEYVNVVPASVPATFAFITTVPFGRVTSAGPDTEGPVWVSVQVINAGTFSTVTSPRHLPVIVNGCGVGPVGPSSSQPTVAAEHNSRSRTTPKDRAPGMALFDAKDMPAHHDDGREPERKRKRVARQARREPVRLRRS
jgi:hypothetical protein